MTGSVSGECRDAPSSYRVTSPSKVRSSRPGINLVFKDLYGLGWIIAKIWAVFKIKRISLNDGATNRRDEMARIASWCLNESSRASGVKKVEIVGTSILSFDRVDVSW